MAKKQLSEYDLFVVIDIICHGRPYSPEQVWLWLDEDEIEDLVFGDDTIFNLMVALDSAEKCGRILEVNNTKPIPEMSSVGTSRPKRNNNISQSSDDAPTLY